MKAYVLAIILSAALVSPSFVFAANDVTLSSSDAKITANGVTVSVSGGHNVDSITVDSGSFDVVMSKSSLVIVSSDRKAFTVSPDRYKTSFECKDDESVLTLERNEEGTDTVTVTPSSDTCSTSSGGGGGGGGGGGSSGGGGGGGGATEVVAVAQDDDETTVPAQIVATPSAVAVVVSPVFNGTLSHGMSNADVKRLQQLLNSDPDTQIAASGVGSAGNETNYFGGLTEDAVKRFQAKHGVVSSGSPETTGYGLVGPATRAKLQEVFSKVSAKVPVTPSAPTATGSTDPELVQLVELLIALEIIPSDKAEKARSVLQTQAAPEAQVALEVSPVFNQGLSLGTTHSDVGRLQEFLNSDPDTQVASSGAGSPGNETNYFGTLTEDAVKRFQAKYGVATAGDPGYGYVGPKTRAKLQEVFGN